MIKDFFSKISNGIKAHESAIILAVAVVLISLLSFAVGYLVAKEQLKEPLYIENIKNEFFNKIPIVGRVAAG